jgi:hypothetical protein
MKTSYVNKISATSADTLLAIAWAELLRLVLRHLDKPGKGVLIRNIGDSFEVTLPRELCEEDLLSEQTIPFLEPLISAKQDERQSKKGRVLRDGFDYDREREKQQQLIAQLKSLRPELRTPEARLRHEPELEAILSDGPRPELPHYQAINMLKVPDTFNDIVLRWQSLSATQQWLAIALLWRLFSQRENDIAGAMKTWEKLAKDQGIEGKTMVTAVQVINPTTGKGSNVTKSNRLSNGGLESFWLLELLKFKGFMIGAAPYVLKGSKDRKTFVILPQKVELQTLTGIMSQFRLICWQSTAVKQDILASLRLAQVLVEHRRTELTSQQGLEDWEEPPIVSIARGFDVTFYKDMGSAHATMNVSTINIPTWFPDPMTLPKVEEAALLLQEHIRVIRRIEGYRGKEGSDELDLLSTYRDFLSGHDLYPFWQFAARYGSYLFRQREREKDVKRWLPQLTKKGLDRLVMQHQNDNTHLSAILANSGFQHIAAAIREATVNAQRRRTQESDTTYETRYGLGQELMRKARYRDDFMMALSEFIFLYNAETAREEEKLARKLNNRRLEASDYRKYRLRYPVTTADMEGFGKLLDTYPTELVAHMLIAYGYSRREALKPEEIQVDAADEELTDQENGEQEA